MYDVQDLRPTNKEMAVLVLVVFVFMVVVFGSGYMLGLHNAGKDIPDNRDPAAGVRTEIDAAGSSISAAESGIDNAAATADRVEARISDAQERARYVQATTGEGRRLIAECQSILREVRSRGKEKAPQN